jgi:hypothetical protein
MAGYVPSGGSPMPATARPFVAAAPTAYLAGLILIGTATPA